MPFIRRIALLLSLIASSVVNAHAQQANDPDYTARIRELTPTDPTWKFTTEVVDHLPASSTVPTVLKVLGYVPGIIGRLSRTEDLTKYFRAVDAASPRVKVFLLGMSEEGREMIIAAVADSATPPTTSVPDSASTDSPRCVSSSSVAGRSSRKETARACR